MMLLISKINPVPMFWLLDSQEKNEQVMKSKRQAQILLFERERRKRLGTELEAYRTKENLLKSEIERLATALNKVLLNLMVCF